MFATLSQQHQESSLTFSASSPSSSPISWSEDDRPTGYPITFALSPISSSSGVDKSNSGNGPVVVVDVSCDDISKKIEACMVSPSKSSALNTCDDTIKFYCNMCMKSWTPACRSVFFVARNMCQFNCIDNSINTYRSCVQNTCSYFDDCPYPFILKDRKCKYLFLLYSFLSWMSVLLHLERTAERPKQKNGGELNEIHNVATFPFLSSICKLVPTRYAHSTAHLR